MGQHKYNKTAIAAARGEILPKPQKKSKHQCDAEIRAMVLASFDQFMEKHTSETNEEVAEATMGVFKINRYA